jgi:2-dehydro-3-deoxyphosphogluconate aldolase / (4S)-4-hydroxy-2-oxoglutarate aldolase
MMVNFKAAAQRIEQAGVIAVLIIDRAEDAVPLAEVLTGEGVTAVELTLRTPSALESVREIAGQVNGMMLGAGTLLTPEQVRAAKEAGAEFGAAPGCRIETIEAAAAAGLLFTPGIAVPSDIERALPYGCTLLKFFPAEGLGGARYLRGMASPYAGLGLRFIPLGGLTPENVRSYLELEEVAAVGGSWIAPRNLVAQREWLTIARNAREAMKLFNEVRG